MSATSPESGAERVSSARAADASRTGPTVTGVAILLPDLAPEAWIVDLIERVAEHPRLRLHLASVADAAPSPAARETPGERFARALLRSPLVDRPRFDRHARRPTPLPDAYRPVASDALAPDEVDVLLDVGARDPALERRLAPGTPLWSARVERLDGLVERALLARAPLILLPLWRRDATRPDAPWARLASHAMPRQSYSFTDLSGAAFRALPAVLVSRLGWFAAGHDPRAIEAASLVAPTDTGSPGAPEDPPDAPPGGGAALAALRLLARRNLARVANRLGGERWELAVTGGVDDGGTTEGTADGVLERVTTPALDDWRALEPPADRIWADPHLCRHDGETHLFFEELVRGAAHAHVCTARLDARGALAESPRRALVEPFHLSYPFVFEHAGVHWMLPETAARRTVSLYRATRFPEEWRHAVDLLVDVDLADSTLHRHDGRWWLFTNRFTHRTVDERDELLIFFADALEGPWTPHALNPVVTGVDRARMAGPVFEDGGHRYRPNQYGAVRYGHGINLARIDVLTRDDYRETPVHRLLPGPGSRWLGCHSLASAGGLSVVDRVRRG